MFKVEIPLELDNKYSLYDKSNSFFVTFKRSDIE